MAVMVAPVVPRWSTAGLVVSAVPVDLADPVVTESPESPGRPLRPATVRTAGMARTAAWVATAALAAPGDRPRVVQRMVTAARAATEGTLGLLVTVAQVAPEDLGSAAATVATAVTPELWAVAVPAEQPEPVAPEDPAGRLGPMVPQPIRTEMAALAEMVAR